MLTEFEAAPASRLPSSASGASVDSRARFEFVGPSVCDGSLLNEGRSDMASSDTEDSRDPELEKPDPGGGAKPALDLGWLADDPP